MPPIVEIRELTYAYRGREERPALRGLDLTIERGEFLAVAGRTGAGKSTLCYALNGLAPHSFGGRLDGEARVDGVDTRRATVPELARKVGLVLQSAESQITGLTVAEEVEFGLENLGLPAAEILARAREALQVVGLADLAERSPWTLSGGQKQRLAIAAALALRPAILALDNPTAELDPLGKEEVLETVARLNREHELTIVLVDQELQEVIPYASRLALLDAGRIARIGPPGEVLNEAELVRDIGLKLPDVTEAAFRLRQAGRWAGPLPVALDDETVGRFKAQGARDKEQASRNKAQDTRPSPLPPPPSTAFAPRPTPHAPRPAPHALIQVENLTFRYPGGETALVEVNLTVQRGEFLALMGPNGAGKTTLAKHLNGLLKPSAGRVLIDGADTREHTVAQLAARVGYVFQNPDHQIFAPTVADELAFGPRNLGWPEGRIQEAVAHTLAGLGLAEQAGAEPFFMGLAERKLIAIGSVLIMGPDVLVLDEPATGADYGVARRIMRYVAGLHRQGLTVIMVTHDVALAAAHAGRLAVLRAGRIALDGPPRELFRDPEALRACHVRPPQITELARRLWAGGAGAPEAVLSVEELLEAL